MDDDSITAECSHTKKALFTSSSLSLDLRYLVWTNEDNVKDPQVEIRSETLKNRDLLGPAAVSEFTLEEGQVVVFILRETGDFSYSNAEHERVANPKPQRAETLGVPLDQLLQATSRLRPKTNPILTKVSPATEAND